MSLSTSCHLEEAYEEEKNEGNHTEASAAEKIPPVQALLREQTQHPNFHRKTHYFHKEGKCYRVPRKSGNFPKFMKVLFSLKNT